jgi:hypothetical protein
MNPPPAPDAPIGVLIVGAIVLFAINALFNGFCMWVTVNHVLSVRGGATYKQCVICTLLLSVVVIAAALFLLVPIPVVNFVLFLIVLWKGSVAVVEGILELPEGGCTVIIAYIIVGAILGWIAELIFM